LTEAVKRGDRPHALWVATATAPFHRGLPGISGQMARYSAIVSPREISF